MNPTKEDAKRLVRKYGGRAVVILHFTRERFAAVSWGANKRECAAFAPVVDAIADALSSGEIAVPEE